MRCAEHQLVCGPDGMCVLCRQKKKPPVADDPDAGRGRTRALRLGALGGAVAVALAVGVSQLGRHRREPPPAAADTTQAAEPAALPEPSAVTTGEPEDPGAADEAPEPESSGTAADPGASDDLEPASPAGPRPRGPHERKGHRGGLAAAAQGAHVIVYTKSACPKCARATQWLTSKGVPFEERSVDTSRENAQALRQANPAAGVPTFVVNGSVVTSFDRPAIVALVKQSPH